MVEAKKMSDEEFEKFRNIFRGPRTYLLEADARLADGLPVRVHCTLHQSPDYWSDNGDIDFEDIKVFWRPKRPYDKLYPCNKKLTEGDIELLELALLEEGQERKIAKFDNQSSILWNRNILYFCLLIPSFLLLIPHIPHGASLASAVLNSLLVSLFPLDRVYA